MTNIEWTDETWNPVVGCSLASPGCTNCYAMAGANRLLDKPGNHYEGTTQRVNGRPVWTGKLALAPDRILLAPLKRRRPTMWFVNSMGDLFHEDVPNEWIDTVFAVMALCPHHTFQVLTKRADRMRNYLLADNGHARARIYDVCQRLSEIRSTGTGIWPLTNVWLGVSVEDQKRANERIPPLLNTPAVIRFVSCEPLLGPVNLRDIPVSEHVSVDALTGLHSAVSAVTFDELIGRSIPLTVGLPRPLPSLDWIIVGGESGPRARPMHPDWARSLRDQRRIVRTPFFFKQNGEYMAVYDRDKDDPDWRRCDAVARETPNGQWLNLAGGCGFHGDRVVRVVPVGKRKSGRLLDGVEWNEMPGDKQSEEAA